jgi:1-acyl-sn-glycerol-3-phosphate acyltransferase
MSEASILEGAEPRAEAVEPSSPANRFWRVFATGFCFSVFGIGGLLLRVAVFPLFVLIVRHHRRRSALARATIRATFRVFVGLLCRIGVCSLQIEGRERLERRGLLILANHPSLIDVVFLMSLVEHADCIVKGTLVRNPFTRGPVRAAGWVCNDSGPALIDDCIASLRAGNNLIIFPEGTRTPAGQSIGKLQRGAANLAVRGGFAVTPVRIHSAPRMLAKGVPWWRVPPRRGHFRIEVGEDIAVGAHLADQGAQALAARRLNEELARHLGA